jgi:D-alanyl-D-alanine carboxypeptidase (penicillin-binding protein 5/6)
VAAGGAARQVAGQRRAPVPCPKPKVAPPPDRPPRPVPPPDDPQQRAIGGDALATDGLTVPSGAPRPPAVSATSWLVADLDTGEVLGGCGPHVYGTPASVQKLLLAATAMDDLDAGRKVQITAEDLDIEPGSSAVGLVAGGRYDVRTLWLGLLLNSGNDAANALARVAGGSGGVRGTVAEMNTLAERLGAYQTHAVTPSGLDGPGQFTSAYDLALIARACFGQADFRRYALTRSAQIPAQPKAKGFQIQNENKLIYNYPGALGGKTGFTTLARHSYVGAAARGGRRLVVTLLGAEARPLRGWQQGAALLDWGFSLPRDASVGTLVAPGDVGATAGEPEAGPSAGDPSPAATAEPRRALPASAGSRGGLSLPIAAVTVAVGLAAAPVVLLLNTRRRRLRRRVRRRV